MASLPPSTSSPMWIALVFLALAAAAVVGYIVGARSAGAAPAAEANPTPPATGPSQPPVAGREASTALSAERARLVRSYESAQAHSGARARSAEGLCEHLATLAGERHDLHRALAEAREETARYRDLVIAIENDAAPPLLGERGAPDDLKLIVGVGPVLERMLHQLGITSYRQIALWTERDIDAIDARLPEFRGRVRRDGWVTQARALHQGLYGEPPRR